MPPTVHEQIQFLLARWAGHIVWVNMVNMFQNWNPQAASINHRDQMVAGVSVNRRAPWPCMRKRSERVHYKVIVMLCVRNIADSGTYQRSHLSHAISSSDDSADTCRDLWQNLYKISILGEFNHLSAATVQQLASTHHRHLVLLSVGDVDVVVVSCHAMSSLELACSVSFATPRSWAPLPLAVRTDFSGQHEVPITITRHLPHMFIPLQKDAL